MLFARENDGSSDRTKLKLSISGFRLPASMLIFFAFAATVVGQYYNPYQNLGNQNAFRQEIARLDISVERPGNNPLPINMVPRVQRGDIIRVRMLDQPINGIRPNESRWNWTLVVAYINPSIREASDESVSREVNFRLEGWYREHSFKVPYDSQPIFFLYPRPSYRNKIRKFLNRNFDDVRKIGEKTLEIAGAYAQIGSFLNQLQYVIEQDRYGYGGYNGYGGYYNFGYGGGLRQDYMKEQFVERLAQSFNIALPNCWTNRFGSRYGGYNNNNYNRYNSNDFTSRAQCVAQNVRIEDFDLSVSQILKQGGLLASTKLVRKYPELAHWISVAAVAADLILKITKKTPLKILPTMAHSGGGGQNYFNRYSVGQTNPSRLNLNRLYQQNQTQPKNSRSTRTLSNPYVTQRQPGTINSQPISVFADKPPADSNYVSAFPIVLHKWQPQPDPEVITLPVPKLLEPCLHIGRNILKNTDLTYDWLRDPYARDFKLVLSSSNGFTKEFPIAKNMGMSGWDLMLTPQDVEAIPKIRMTLEAQIIATRGFNKIRSQKFEVPVPGSGNWAVTDDARSSFAVGGKRRFEIVNVDGLCFCLKSVKYKPSFGGEFEFAVQAEANPITISEDGTYAWFDIDTTEFKPGKGNLEVYSYGSVKPQIVPVNLYGPPPKVGNMAIHKGDRYISIDGMGTEQITAVTVNGKKARLDKNATENALRESTRIFVFEDPAHIIRSKTANLEMVLVGNRRYKYPKVFPVLPARPTLAADSNGEIEADLLGAAVKRKTRFDLSSYSVAPVDIDRMTVPVRTSLTDYDFRAENITVETRIENGLVGEKELPVTTFEVIDSVNMRIDFAFDKQHQQFLAGRRIQFRIRDRKRGVSNWYTIKQTFIRIPRITSVSCRSGRCTIVGKGLDYIGQYSTDGGSTWKPPLQAKAKPDGSFFLVIPEVKNKLLLRIRLRDFSETEGLSVTR